MSDFEVPTRAQFEALSAQVAGLGTGGGGGGGSGSAGGMGRGADAGSTVTLDASRGQVRSAVRTNRGTVQKQFNMVRMYTDRVELAATVLGISVNLVDHPPVAVVTTDAAGQTAAAIDLTKYPGRVTDMSASVPSLNEFCTLNLPFPLRLPANGYIDLMFAENVDMTVYEERDDTASDPVNGIGVALFGGGVPQGGFVYFTAGGSGGETERAAGALPAFGMRVVKEPTDMFTGFLLGSFEIVDDGVNDPYMRYHAFNTNMYVVPMMPESALGGGGGGEAT